MNKQRLTNREAPGPSRRTRAAHRLPARLPGRLLTLATLALSIAACPGARAIPAGVASPVRVQGTWRRSYPFTGSYALRGPARRASGRPETSLLSGGSGVRISGAYADFGPGAARNRLPNASIRAAGPGSGLPQWLKWTLAVFAVGLVALCAGAGILLYINHRLAAVTEHRTKELSAANERLRREILQRERIRQELSENEARLRSITDTSPDYICTLDKELRIEFANRTVPGLSVADVVGTSICDLLQGTERQSVEALLRGVLGSGETVTYETVFAPLDGSAMHFETRAGPRRLPDTGEIVGITLDARDVTERRRAEEELAKYREHLEDLVRERTAELEKQHQRVAEANRLKSVFLSTMSHELRTPLNSVLSLSQLLLSRGVGKKPESDEECLRVIARNGKLLLSLINEILDLAKIEAGRMEMEVRDFLIDRAVEAPLATIRPLLAEKGIALDVEIPDLSMMHSDERHLGQILLNLLSNAAKFTERGRVRLTVSESRGTVAFAVSDTGMGIRADALPFVFEEFRQVDGSSTRRHGGTGLGLAISQKLAHLLGGWITAASEPGKGSTFTLVLPLRISTRSEDGTLGSGGTGADPLFDGGDLPGRPILVVEDNPDNQLALRGILDEMGIRYVIVGDGAAAVEAAKRIVPGLILMDMQLPVMDGTEATRRIKADPELCEVPVVAVTAKAMKGDREKILAAGCDDYLAKPISPGSVVRMVRKWMGAE